MTRLRTDPRRSLDRARAIAATRPPPRLDAPTHRAVLADTVTLIEEAIEAREAQARAAQTQLL